MNSSRFAVSPIRSSSLLAFLFFVNNPLPAGEAVVIAEVAKLVVPHGDAFDRFGHSVSLDGDLLAVGAYVDDDNATVAGKVYVFERTADGVWARDAEISPLDIQSFHHFGRSVSLDGVRLAIGAPRDNSGDANGSVYIFEQTGGIWTQVIEILPPDGGAGDDSNDHFGRSVSLDGDRVLVGSYLDDDNGLSSGSAYIFERDADGNWFPVAKIAPLDGEAGDHFGEWVSLSADHLAVSGGDSVYVFERKDDGNWEQVAMLEAGGGFGNSVSLDVDRLAIGSRGDGDGGLNSGAAYLFERDTGGNWAQIAKIQLLEGRAHDKFGQSVSLDGDHLAVSAFDDRNNADRPGAGYLFERRADGSWTQTAKMSALDEAPGLDFGNSVSLDGGRISIGVPGDDDSGRLSGSAYVFEPVLVSPQLSISGTCPGEIESTRSGTTPRSLIRLYSSASEGNFTFSDGPCAGTSLGLDAPDLLKQRNGEFQPERTVLRTVDEFWCGRYLQLIDEKTCLTSEVVQTP